MVESRCNKLRTCYDFCCAEPNLLKHLSAVAGAHIFPFVVGICLVFRRDFAIYWCGKQLASWVSDPVGMACVCQRYFGIDCRGNRLTFSIKNLQYRFSKKYDEIDCEKPEYVIKIDALDLPHSGMIAVVGPSGSGKTTLLSLLAGFLDPEFKDDGHLKFSGRSFGKLGHAPGDVAFVFQDPTLMGAANGVVNALQGRIARRTAGKFMDQPEPALGTLFKLFGLVNSSGSLVGKRTRHLSGGEAQRLSIIRAILTDPKAILCDEPTSALDEGNAEIVLKCLDSWSEDKQRPVIWVTHNLDQAAEYAKHFVFIKNGELFHPSNDEKDILQASKIEDRRTVLKKISQNLRNEKLVARTLKLAKAGDSTDAPTNTLPTENIKTVRYLGWIADAMSTDGLFVKKIEAASEGTMERQSLRKLVSQTSSLPQKGSNWLQTLLRRAVSYPRYGLALVLIVMLAQVWSAEFAGKFALSYAEEQLENPAVARLVLEHVVGRKQIGQTLEPEALDPELVVPAMEDELRAKVSALGGDPRRVRIFGRRSIAGSQIRFPTANDACRGWQPLETVALAAEDPLILQAKLVSGDPNFFPSPEVVQAKVLEQVIAFETGKIEQREMKRFGLLDAGIVEILRARCGLNIGQPVVAEWAPGQAGAMRPLELRIIASFNEAPPLHPNFARLLVFEHDFQYASNAMDVQVDPPRIASVYFPIDGFMVAKKLVAERGYVLRDDSAAAVETLQQVASAAKSIPGKIVQFNLVGCFVVIMLVIWNLLELNKRVLALFIAHGFRRWHLLYVLLRHVVPAFLGAIVTVSMLGFAVWIWSSRFSVSVDLMRLSDLRDMAFLKSIFLLVVVGIVALIVVVFSWWWKTTSNLKTYLQE